MKNKGIIAINKPSGWTSFDVVNKIKHMVKPLKTGHLGTLDPMATGVLLVTIGKATKLFDLMQEKKKTYLATFEFGYLTDTLDITGKITENCEHIPTKQEIEDILPKFVGKISQIPPKYSAKSIGGKRAYELARNNIEFEIKPKVVEIYAINLISYKEKQLTLEIECGSGTYIRSIGRDIAEQLNTFATMTALERRKVGNFDVNNCHKIENLQNIDNLMAPIKEILSYKTLNLSHDKVSKLLNGQTINIEKQDGIFMLEDEFDVIALVKIQNLQAKMILFLG